jgi:hypothetical protein
MSFAQRMVENPNFDILREFINRRFGHGRFIVIVPE